MPFNRKQIILITSALAGLTAACASKPDPAVSYVAPVVGMEITFKDRVIPTTKIAEEMKAVVKKAVRKNRRKKSRKAKSKAKVATAPKLILHRIIAAKGDTVSNLVISKSESHDSVRENQTLRSIMTYFIYQRGDGIIREDFTHTKIRSLWPLKIGNKTNFISKLYFARGKTQEEATRKAKHTDDVTRTLEVVREEVISVPAGRFRSFLIRRTAVQRKLDGTLSHQSIKNYWFAPSIGWIIRIDTTTKLPGKKDRTRSIVAISIKGAKPKAKK